MLLCTDHNIIYHNTDNKIDYIHNLIWSYFDNCLTLNSLLCTNCGMYHMIRKTDINY